MAAIHKLSPRKVATVKPGKHEDGGGLRLVVSNAGARKWVLRFSLNGKRREMGLVVVNSRNWRSVRKRLSTRFWRNSFTMNFIARNPNKPETILKKEKKFKWGSIWGTK